MTTPTEQAPKPTNEIKQAEAPPSKPSEKKRSSAIWWLTTGVLIIALGWFLLWFFYLRFHESTDDAYVNGNLVNVTSVISGSPVAFFADDTDYVKEGDLLVLLDSTPHQVRFDKELATLAATVLQVRQLYNTVHENAAIVENRRISRNRASYDYENRKSLIDVQAISNEDFIHSKDDLNIAELNLKQAEYQLQVSQDAAGNTPLEQHPLIEQQKSNIRDAFYNLKHCAIYAATTGFIAQRQVEVGQWVTPTTAMMAIIPKDYMWVDANFKETQLTFMRIGQPASFTLDVYGSRVKFEGKVLGIASGTGSVFSLIPPQNATGNWIKIVQRLPVRISIDPEQMQKYPFRLGLSANVNVNITEADLPALAPISARKPIATTEVFDLDFQELEKTMEKIIADNLMISTAP